MRVFLLVLGCSAPTASSPDLAQAQNDLAQTQNDLAQTQDDLAHAALHFSSNFAGSDGANWPAPWIQLGGAASATIQSGRGRIVPTTSSYSLGRMGVRFSVRDVEVTYNLMFEDAGTQGVGFYVRQNGGWLAHTNPTGSGYGIFVEDFRGPRMAMWRENNGVEMEIPNSAVTLTLASGVSYSVRFRVSGASPTRLQGRLWPTGQAEPSTWQIDLTDDNGPQGAGGIAVDSWSTATTGTLTAGTSIDDVEVNEL